LRDARERLRDILEAIERIDRYATRGRAAFDSDELVQNWIVRHLQIIGEAVRTTPEEIRAAAPDVPWPKITGMRHVLVHDYFGIDLDLVWAVVQNELGPLRRSIERLLADLEQ
jgi:uncharacterized protein with HEPN domain